MVKSSHALKEQFDEKLKKLSADFEFFAHITSHDLRDPLRQARIYGDELITAITKKEDKQKLGSINVLIDEVLQKIAILRDFSYVANDKEEPIEVDLNEVIKEVMGDFPEQIKSSGIDIKTNSLPKVKGNPKHLKRLFACLIDNAVKFRRDKVKLKINIEANKKSGLWDFVISDNGIGLDEVYRELVFVLFQKLDTSAGNKSYGAGLAFARKIVENHGGTIWYKSDGESGTAFHFTIKG